MRASVSLTLLLFLLAPDLSRGQDAPLHQIIDSHFSSPDGMTPSLCNDAEFLRRVSLDLTGMPPTADEVRSFLEDADPEKRARAIDRLLDSPHFDRHLTTTLDIMLMERRPNTHVPQDEWYAWLLASVRERKPWNVIVREILTADGDTTETRPQAHFLLDRESEPNLLTRDIGRIFFGRDLQCAQCHDHPLIDDYLQADYQGLLAFLSPSYAVVRKETVKEGDKETTKEVTLLAEKAGSNLSFESVFIQGTPHRTGPRLPDDVEIEEPFFLPGEEYEVAPAEGVKSVPRFSRRAKLAELATSGSNRMFNENIVNRLWAQMLGRGLVHPVDLHHYDNPPTDPALLKLLGERFAAMNFDMRSFLREVALSHVYQRSFDLPDGIPESTADAVALVSELEQQAADLEEKVSSSRKTFEESLTAWGEAEAATIPAANELDTARTAGAEAQKKHDEAQQELTKAQNELQQKQTALSAVQQAATAAQQAVESLKDDAELAAAAQKFAERSQQLTDAVAGLTKSVEEKSATATATTEALQAATTAIETARANVAPLEEALRGAERAMLEARRQMRDDEIDLSALNRRLDTVKAIATLPEKQQAIADTRQHVEAQVAARATAESAMTEYGNVLAERQTAMTAAEEAVETANEGLAQARGEQTQQIEIAMAIRTAAEAARIASEKLPDDAVLVESAQKLAQRADALNAELGQAQARIDQAQAKVNESIQARDAARAALDEAQTERSHREQLLAEAENALTEARETLASREAEYAGTMAYLTDRWSNDFALTSLTPLTPEQLCWSIFRVTGVYDRYWQAELAELDKSNPLTDEQRQDPAALVTREREIEQRTFDKLKSNVTTFVQFYGAAAGQPQSDFFATADQALFAANGSSINSWVAPSGGNVTERMINAPNPEVAAEELYLTVLNRLPAEHETADVTAYLAAREADRAAAAQELVWGLLNSIEFRFNH